MCSSGTSGRETPQTKHSADGRPSGTASGTDPVATGAHARRGCGGTTSATCYRRQTVPVERRQSRIGSVVGQGSLLSRRLYSGQRRRSQQEHQDSAQNQGIRLFQTMPSSLFLHMIFLLPFCLLYLPLCFLFPCITFPYRPSHHIVSIFYNFLIVSSCSSSLFISLPLFFSISLLFVLGLRFCQNIHTFLDIPNFSL